MIVQFEIHCYFLWCHEYTNLGKGYGNQSEKSHWGQKDTLLIIFIESEREQPLKKRIGSFRYPVYNQNQKNKQTCWQYHTSILDDLVHTNITKHTNFDHI